MKTICNENELQKAINNKTSKIVVEGELALKLRKLKPIFELNLGKKLLLCASLSSLILNPLGRVSMMTAKNRDMDKLVKIIMASGISITLIIAVIKGYTIEIMADKVILTKK